MAARAALTGGALLCLTKSVREAFFYKIASYKRPIKLILFLRIEFPIY